MVKQTKRRCLEVADIAGAIEDNLVVGRFFAPEDLAASLEDFEPALMIDEHALDDGLLRQPDLFYRVSQILSLQISRRDAAKQYVANQEALVDQQLRRTGMSDKRTTEKEIEAQKRINANVVKAVDQLLRMEHSVRQWTNLKEAVIQRGHALRELVNLYVANYYTTGSVTVSEDKTKRHALDRVRDHYKKKSRRTEE